MGTAEAVTEVPSGCFDTPPGAPYLTAALANPTQSSAPTGALVLADGSVFLGEGLGAIGAACIIWAFKSGGVPNYVMPLVFGGAPVINVLVTMILHPPKSAVNPLLFVGMLLVVLGASLVLYFRPQS